MQAPFPEHPEPYTASPTQKQNKHNTRKASLKTLPPKIILQRAQQFTQQNPPPTTRRRKPHSPEALLWTLALTMSARPSSDRALPFWAQVFLPDVSLPNAGVSVGAYSLGALARFFGVAGGTADRTGAGTVGGAGRADFGRAGVGGWDRGRLRDAVLSALMAWGTGTGQIAWPVKGLVLGYWEGGVIWLVGASLGGAYADVGRLLDWWLLCYEWGVLGSGVLWVGDGLSGHRARLWERMEAVGWLPVVGVRDGVWRGVRAGARKRVRAEVYGWAFGECYRIEQVFGGFKRAYGGYVECGSVLSSQMRVWGMLVLWDKRRLVNVWGCFFFCVVWVLGVWCVVLGEEILLSGETIFEHLHSEGQG